MKSNKVKVKKCLRRVVSAGILPTALVATWHISVSKGWVTPTYAVYPAQVVASTHSLASDLLPQVLVSLRRLLIGVIGGATLGVITGIVSARVRNVRDFLNPTLQLLAPVPVIVWLPFVIMIFGLGEAYKISLIMLATLLLVHIYSFGAAREMSKSYFELTDIYEKSFMYRLFGVTLPAIAGSAFIALRTSLALGWIVVFLVEYADATEVGGLGYYIRMARDLGQTERSFAGVLVLAIAAFVLDLAVYRIQVAFLRWKDVEEEGDA